MAKPASRLPLLVLAVIALVSGVLAGLARLSWPMPEALPVAQHGALMIAAFFGTVISLERAVALGRDWGYLAPLCAGLGGIALLLGLPQPVAAGLACISAITLVAANIIFLRQQFALFTFTLGLGALALLAGNGIWLVEGHFIAAIPCWILFLVLTIAGERLELTRYLPTPAWGKGLFALLLAVLCLGALPLGWFNELRLLGGGLLAIALWLMRYDIARRTVRQAGLTRYIALCLLLGYVWLAVGGLLALGGGLVPGAPWRDGALHALLLGFVLSMVFGHAPIIVPAIARVKVPWHPVLYLPLALLHLSVLTRVAANLVDNWPLRQYAGLGNALTLAVFMVVLLKRILQGRRT